MYCESCSLDSCSFRLCRWRRQASVCCSAQSAHVCQACKAQLFGQQVHQDGQSIKHPQHHQAIQNNNWYSNPLLQYLLHFITHIYAHMSLLQIGKRSGSSDKEAVALAELHMSDKAQSRGVGLDRSTLSSFDALASA